MIYHSSKDNLKVSIICNFVSDWHNMDAEKIFANHRKRESVEARHLLFYLIRKNTRLSFQDIGLLPHVFGINRSYNHATVLHGYNRVRDRIDVERLFRFQMKIYNDQIESTMKKNVKIQDQDKYPEHLSELMQCLNEKKEHREVALLAMYLRKIRDESAVINPQEDFTMEMV
jgi:hypothetical protein